MSILFILFSFLAENLTAEDLFRNSTLNQILASELTIEKKYEPAIRTSKINFLVVGFIEIDFKLFSLCFLVSGISRRKINECFQTTSDLSSTGLLDIIYSG